jgi:hypothetical protein
VPSRKMRSNSCSVHECCDWAWRPEQDHGSSAENIPPAEG